MRPIKVMNGYLLPFVLQSSKINWEQNVETYVSVDALGVWLSEEVNLITQRPLDLDKLSFSYSENKWLIQSPECRIHIDLLDNGLVAKIEDSQLEVSVSLDELFYVTDAFRSLENRQDTAVGMCEPLDIDGPHQFRTLIYTYGLEVQLYSAGYLEDENSPYIELRSACGIHYKELKKLPKDMSELSLMIVKEITQSKALEFNFI